MRVSASRSAWIVVLVVILLAAAFALRDCSVSKEDQEIEDTITASSEATEESFEGDEEVVEEEVPEVEFHEAQVEVTGDEIAVITTSKGVIRVEFFADAAPNHVGSFIELVESGFYDGVKFHRVEPGFVIQGGDPLSKTDDPAVGTGGPGYYLKAEFNSRLHLDGTLSMARAQHPDSAGSQFFICLGEQSFLDGQYTVFGQVVEGLDVVHTIEVGDIMESVTVERPE